MRCVVFFVTYKNHVNDTTIVRYGEAGITYHVLRFSSHSLMDYLFNKGGKCDSFWRKVMLLISFVIWNYIDLLEFGIHSNNGNISIIN